MAQVLHGVPASCVRVPGFKFWLRSQSQLPARPQVMTAGRLMLGPCLSLGKPGLSSWLLALAWEVNQHMERSVCLCLSALQMNENI